VLPDGQQIFDTMGGKLAATQSFTVGVPATAIPGTGRLLVRVYPGVVSQVLEGLEGLLQTPYGCFEQTSSVTYPNVMVLDYLEATGQAAPRIQLQAEQLINLGYQRLLAFEVRGEPGGFSLFGDPPAQMMLTAYGLMEFGDMAGVAYVDPDLMARVAAYLANRATWRRQLGRRGCDHRKRHRGYPEPTGDHRVYRLGAGRRRLRAAGGESCGAFHQAGAA
jgi:uncharacterized protein YfaS (alpha-2-macroglobulin family)